MLPFCISPSVDAVKDLWEWWSQEAALSPSVELQLWAYSWHSCQVVENTKIGSLRTTSLSLETPTRLCDFAAFVRWVIPRDSSRYLTTCIKSWQVITLWSLLEKSGFMRNLTLFAICIYAFVWSRYLANEASPALSIGSGINTIVDAAVQQYA